MKKSELDLSVGVAPLCPNERPTLLQDNEEVHILLLRYLQPLFTLPADGELPRAPAAMGRSGI